MIAQLKGTVVEVDHEMAVVDVSGIGFAVRMSASDLSRLRSGCEATVFTHLAISQDAVSLYGFLDKRARDLFLDLQKVSGVGPKAALALLSVMTVDQLLTAIDKQDVAALTKAKGVGKRGAQKVILELSGKIADLSQQEKAAAIPHNMGQVIDGLVSLGWQESQARPAVDEVMEDQRIEGDIPQDRIADVLRRSLALLGRSVK